MGTVLLTPTPAAAFFQVIIPAIVLEAKKDKNFKAVNPYETKKVTKKSKKRR